MKTKKEIVRYLIVTPFIGSADFGIYFLLIRVLPFSAAKAISYAIANTVGYLFGKYWIFKRKRSSYHEAGRYILLDLFLLGCNVAANQAVLSVWPHAVFYALAVASILTMLLSFACKKWWVFKKT